ncbi:MAG: ferrous iron transporter B [Candidatus Erginobacter occultus]|nr:ferrous iron transporter B [Candidatus Erginobacter occultus]
MKKIVLMGNPNVGKSVLFHRLTGVQVIASNYPGTTVGFTRGFLTFPRDTPTPDGALFGPGERVEIIDAPGIYSLEAASRADRVAVEILEGADLVISVVDATNLERNLCLTLQLLEREVPVLVALNLWDETRHLGIEITPEKLEEMLGVPVVPTVAVSGEGIRRLVERLQEARPGGHPAREREERWPEMGRIVSSCQFLHHHHHTFLQRLSDLSVMPWTGLPLAALVLLAAFWLVRFIGESLIGYVADPIFEGLYLPLLEPLSEWLGPGSLLHSILIGRLIDGEIDFLQSFGVLTTGLYVELAMVLPYIISFYLVLSFLEDFGYLPRLAVLLDGLMHRVGLHGYAIIPTLLGLGCNVPAVMATRILENRRERFIAATLISIGVPCAALQAMIFGLVGARGGQYVAAVYFTLFMVWLILGFLMNRLVKGYSPELIIEIPHYRLPPPGPFFKKLRSRIVAFLKEALPVVTLAVLAVNLLYALDIFNILAGFFAPVVTVLFGLPREAIVPILIGLLRKDVAVGMLGPLNLSAGQLVVATTVLAMFFPCIATFAILLKELGWRDMLKSTGIMFVVAILVGSLLNLLL